MVGDNGYYGTMRVGNNGYHWATVGGSNGYHDGTMRCYHRYNCYDGG